jgi:hypothetical protein
MGVKVRRWLLKLCRRGLALVVILTLALLVLALGAAIYLNVAGFPGFLKARIIQSLSGAGLDIGLEEARLAGLRTVVVDRVHLNLASTSAAALTNLRIEFNAAGLRKFRLIPEAATIQDGEIRWHLETSNGYPRHALVNNIRIDLELPSPQRQVARFSGLYQNCQLHGILSLTNASALRGWRTRPVEPDAKQWRQQLTELLIELQDVRFANGSSITVHGALDGNEPNSLRAEIQLSVPEARSGNWTLSQVEVKGTAAPWPGGTRIDLRVESGRAETSMGDVRQVHIGATIVGSITNGVPDQIEWDLQTASFSANSLTGQSLTITGRTSPGTENNMRARSRLKLGFTGISGDWGRVEAGVLTATTDHGWRGLPVSGDWRLAAERIETTLGMAMRAEMSGRVSSCTSSVPMDEENWGYWRWFSPFELDWSCRLEQITSPHEVTVESIDCAGSWRAPKLEINNLRAELCEGKLEGTARMDVVTRELMSSASMNFDVHKISQLLTPNSRRWLSQYNWEKPPFVTGETRLIMPAWTNTHPNWREEVLPTMLLDGAFIGTNGSFRAMPVAFASSRFSLSNFVWRLPDLVVKRPDGEALLDYTGDMRTQDYYWRVEGIADPRAVLPLVEEPVRKALAEFEFSEPVCVSGEIRGRWHEPETVGFHGRIAARDFVFRGERCDELAATVQFTNMFLALTDGFARQGRQHATAPAGGYDLAGGLIYMTNVISTMDPAMVTKLIGPKTRAALEPYHFEQPPTVRINGQLPVLDLTKADALFELAGETLQFRRFNLTFVTADVHWRGQALSISNLHSGFYNGALFWQGDFDFSADPGTDYRFYADFDHVDLRGLLSDLGEAVIRVDGHLDGQLVISSANTQDLGTWQGDGHLRLQDGFLWDIPIFGFFSPVLDAIVPGLGNSPVSAGKATFDIRDGVLRTSDLELLSPALRLRYYGAVDYQGRVDARMQAEILRDAWGVGPVLSFLLRPISKAFEYKITGTFQQPKSEPVHIPRFLLWPLQPVRTVKEILGLNPPAKDPPPFDFNWK